MARIEEFERRCHLEGVLFMYSPGGKGYCIIRDLPPQWENILFFPKSEILAMSPEDLDKAMLQIRLAVLFEP